ncbi:hypothetical protein NGRA_2573 [Nosema granulosis]|uniref:ISXO2-like transposase domain-containing protein n=1 Tax=Nosema granulosis TaxID=83296 RepID=A0A9P6GWE8_9MICR|nr:hypothetical protein NGRA_2573 [Nosema granulosis]
MASIDIISFVCCVGKKTIRKLLDKVTKRSFNHYTNNMELLGGNGMTVENYESKFGKSKYNRDHHVEGVWFIGMVKRSERKHVKLVIVENRKKDTLHAMLKSSIKEDSVIYTDG